MHEIDYIPIAALNQYAYCPHRCWRMFCAGEFIDNQYTLEGTGLHDRVHTLGSNHRDDTWQVRAVWLKSDLYGLIGKSDLIEETDGQLYPVEYKRGHRGREFDNDELQVLQPSGPSAWGGYDRGRNRNPRASIFSYGTQFPPAGSPGGALTPELREDCDRNHCRCSLPSCKPGTMPHPIYTKRCRGCSLYRNCLPQAAKKVSRYRE